MLLVDYLVSLWLVGSLSSFLGFRRIVQCLVKTNLTKAGGVSDKELGVWVRVRVRVTVGEIKGLEGFCSISCLVERGTCSWVMWRHGPPIRCPPPC
jgi:hypothetical protein